MGQGPVQTRSKITTIQVHSEWGNALYFSILFLSFGEHVIGKTEIFVHHPGDCLPSSNYSITVPHELRGFSSPRNKRAKPQLSSRAQEVASNSQYNNSTYTLNQYHIVPHGVTTIHNLYPTSTTQMTLVLGTDVLA